MQKINLSVFFPCYNEEQNIGALLDRTVAFVPAIASDYEIIVVDDGSSDNTAEIANKYSAMDPRIKVIRHETNRGYGAALRTGFSNCRKDYIFFTDGDNQFDITELTKLLPYTGDFDIVAGFRIKRKDNFIRKINEFCFNRAVRILFGLKIRDLNCAFKIYKKKVLESLELRSSWGFINSELLIRARKMGFTIKEVGVTHYPRQWGSQTGASLKVVIGSLSELFKLRKEIR
ncbi:MAG: glycosyltransferase family 2 protein [Nitrospirae bacterium]|nr:glycosyltransferase family 2 protein [Nitrospirota bacterium]